MSYRYELGSVENISQNIRDEQLKELFPYTSNFEGFNFKYPYKIFKKDKLIEEHVLIFDEEKPLEYVQEQLDYIVNFFEEREVFEREKEIYNNNRKNKLIEFGIDPNDQSSIKSIIPDNGWPARFLISPDTSLQKLIEIENILNLTPEEVIEMHTCKEWSDDVGPPENMVSIPPNWNDVKGQLMQQLQEDVYQ